MSLRSITSAGLRGYASVSTATPSSAGKHKIVVIGAGSAGLAAANQLYNSFKSEGRELGPGDIAIVDGATEHHFQPGWTLVGAGLKDKTKLVKPLDELIPGYISHIRSNAKAFAPTSNSVTLENGETVKYDYLVVAAGLSSNFKNIKGLTEALTRPATSSVSSIYSYATCSTTWDLIEAFNTTNGPNAARSGKKNLKAIFTQPFGPVKCAGAPQKIAYMANERWRLTNRREGIDSEFVTGMPTMFAVPHYSKALDALRQSRDISASFNTNLISIDEANKVATFQQLAGEKKTIQKEYDFLHVTPPMGPLEFLKKSELADSAGWVDVSSETLQHKKFENVFALGDCSSLPTSKTAAAITAQTPVLVENLTQLMNTGKVGTAAYDGYTSCPLFTGYGELMLAEFVYGAKPKETFGKFVDQRVPNRAFYHLTKDVFPYVYFNNMVKGNWYGPKGIIPPQYQPSVVPS